MDITPGLRAAQRARRSRLCGTGQCLVEVLGPENEHERDERVDGIAAVCENAAAARAPGTCVPDVGHAYGIARGL